MYYIVQCKINLNIDKNIYNISQFRLSGYAYRNICNLPSVESLAMRANRLKILIS